MKIIFNDILSSSSSPIVSAGEMKFISSNLIFEKRLVLAQVYSTVQELIDAYNKLSTEEEKLALENSSDAAKILNDEKNRKEFNNKSNKYNSKPGSSKPSGGIVSDIAQFGINEAELAGAPGEKFAPFMEKKDQILQRLRPFMSDESIGKVFYDLQEVIKLPFTEVVGILEDVISKARSCNAEVSKVINFFIEHYKEKAQYSLTKRLITEACELQKLNPVVDIFGVLTDAIKGNQPQVGLMYALKDPDAMKSFNELIMLSQSNLPEQSEEVRRRFQKSRDGLVNQQQKVNMQRALYDMMKIEETNKQLVEHIKLFGEEFKLLLTNPMYRALRNMLYDLRAGKIIMNQQASIFMGDRTPETKRSTPQEQSILREDTYAPIVEGRQVFNSREKFVKLASPEVTRYIYSQTAPKAQPKIQEASDGLNRISNAIKDISNKVINAAKSIPFIGDIIKFFEVFYKAFETLWDLLQKNGINASSVAQAFGPILSGYANSSNTAQPSSNSSNLTTNTNGITGVVNPNNPPFYPRKDDPSIYQRNGKFYKRVNGKEVEIMVWASATGMVKTSQRTPQQGTTYSGGSQEKDYITTAIGLVTTIGVTILAGLGIGQAVKSLVRSGGWTDILNSIAPTLKILMVVVQELFNTFNITGNNAPVSSKFYGTDGKLTNEGKRILVNARETMISLGISDADAMALSKFQVEKDYLLQFLNKKEQNLRDFENQSVQTGSGTTESTVGTLPQDFQTKIVEFLSFCEKLEKMFMSNLNIFRNGITNANKQYDTTQRTHIEGQLEEYKADLLTVQKKKADWVSLKKNAARMMRKRILLQKLKPLQLQIDTMKKLGIPMSNIIASPNGILAISGKIRKEVSDALTALRKEHYELSQLIRNPDKISPLVKYPTDTGVTKLPESSDQSESTESPFEAPEDSQFRTEQNANSGAK